MQPALKSPPRPSARLRVRPFGDLDHDVPDVYVFLDVLDELLFHARYRSDDAAALLLGGRYLDPDTERLYVEIRGFSEATYVSDGPSEWLAILHRRRDRLRDLFTDDTPPRAVVGWSFAHAGSRARIDADALLVHASFFNLPGRFVLAIDPDSGELGFYHAAPDRAMRNVGFHLLAPTPEPSDAHTAATLSPTPPAQHHASTPPTASPAPSTAPLQHHTPPPTHASASPAPAPPTPPQPASALALDSSPPTALAVDDDDGDDDDFDDLGDDFDDHGAPSHDLTPGAALIVPIPAPDDQWPDLSASPAPDDGNIEINIELGDDDIEESSDESEYSMALARTLPEAIRRAIAAFVPSPPLVIDDFDAETPLHAPGPQKILTPAPAPPASTPRSIGGMTILGPEDAAPAPIPPLKVRESGTHRIPALPQLDAAPTFRDNQREDDHDGARRLPLQDLGQRLSEANPHAPPLRSDAPHGANILVPDDDDDRWGEPDPNDITLTGHINWFDELPLEDGDFIMDFGKGDAPRRIRTTASGSNLPQLTRGQALAQPPQRPATPTTLRPAPQTRDEAD